MNTSFNHSQGVEPFKKDGQIFDGFKGPLGQSGFSLIEVLVALIILAIGMLGIAGLQVTSLQNNNSALSRTLATIQAYDMADRIRANTEAAAQGLYNNVSGTPQSPPSCQAGSACTPADLASLDIFEWNSANGQLLPSGQGTVAGTGSGSVFTIRIFWDDEKTGVTGTGCDPDEPTDLKCFELDVQI